MVNEKEYKVPDYYTDEMKVEAGHFGWTPEMAVDMLEQLGYIDHEMWDELEQKKGFGSHEWRAYLVIAKGDEIRLIGEVKSKIREEELSPFGED